MGVAMTTDNTMTCVDDLVPHRGDMSLLDEILDYGETWLKARATVTENNLFLTEGRVPSWTGIEYMAQSIAALAGTRSMQRGEPARVGFLVGTRKYQAGQPAFAVGSVLTVVVSEVVMGENGLGVFDCELTCKQPDGTSFVASTRMNVFQPDDFREVFGE